MSNLEILTSAARNAPAWHLVLDKIPFYSRDGLPVLSAQDNGGKPQSIKPKRLQEIVKLTENDATKGLWRKAIASKKSFLTALQAHYDDRFATLTLVNSSRLLLHLGRSSVLENVGLYCDHTTGLPLIPGSAVKGALSTWACWIDHFDKESAQFSSFTEKSVQRSNFSSEEACLAKYVFGDNSSQGSSHSGGIAFLGAFPETPPRLGLDIVNPHVNANGDEIAPRPNIFLCLEPGTKWVFQFFVTEKRDNSKELLERTLSWTREMLSQMGLGAKTAAGYGRFQEKSSSQPNPHLPSGTGGATTPDAPTSESDKIIAKWKSLRETGNFRVALVELEAIKDDRELKKAFESLIPQEKLRQLKRRDAYWQSFTSREQGQNILKRLGLTLN